MPDAPRPPGTGGNVLRAWAQRAGDRRVFPPPRPRHGAADNGRRGEGGGSGAGARGNAGEEAGGRYTSRGGGVADREVAGGASADPAGAGRNAATVAAGGEAPAPPAREESGGGRGGGGVGSKRPSAPPAQLPPPKRRAVFESGQFPPPAFRWTAAARYEGERENRGSGAFEKPAVARPLVARKDGAGALSRAVPPNAAGTRVLKKPYATDGAALGRHGPRAGMVKSSAAQNRGRGAGNEELWGKKVTVTATRLPPKPEIISATRTSLPSRGKDGGFSSKVHRPLESGRAHGGSIVPKELLTIDDHSSLADRDAGEVQAQDDKLEKGEVPSKESRGYQVSSNAALLDSAAFRDVSARDSPGVSGNFGRKTWALAKDVKVMNKYGGSSSGYNTVAASFAKDSFRKKLMRKIIFESGRLNRRASSDVAAGVSGEGNVLRSKDMFTNQNTAKPAKVVQKSDTQHIPFSRDKKETVRGRQTQKKKAATNRDFFGHMKMVKPKAVDHQLRKIASTSVSGSRGKLDDEVISNLTFHDIFRDIKFHERKVELYLNSSSGLPSVRCQRQYRHRNADARSRFKKLCRMFEFVCRTLVQIMEQRSLKMRIDFLAAQVMKKLPGFTKHGPIVGQVPGVEVGDEFLYRSQLAIAGLHSRPRGGIATTTYRNGMLIAISIVASGGYPDELGCSGELIYTGSGGKPAGSRVFKYKLKKIPGQPELPMHIAKRLKSYKSRPGLCMNDISQGKEATPICVINTVDDVQPTPFRYTTRIRYPFRLTEKHQGCDCTNGCSDSVSCACAVKNGGEIPFDLNGTILNEKSVIFECGPSCKCPPSCHNRVSQHDMKIPLEVFRTTKTGWGVRSLRSIPSGSFICEYIGELLHQKEADKRRNNSYLFDVGLNDDDENASSGLLSNVSGLNSSSSCSQTMEDVHFTIDASEYGNIGRFINHSLLNIWSIYDLY
ncbi:uncharacterized protein [Miscanthus floridulus]|uniref:uncharacterized protein n=1 Tax=Miscanthus floridulus TaxID=154761 RepID=UPI003457C279